jgi:hypothetical protein
MRLTVNQAIIIVSLKTLQKLSKYRVRMMMMLKNED